MEKISWPDRVTKKEVLHGSKEKLHILRTVKRRRANSILRKNCLQKHVIERDGRIKVAGRQGRRRNQLLKELKGKSILEIERGSGRLRSVENWLW